MAEKTIKKPAILSAETRKKIDLLRRYWLVYNHAHNNLAWQIKENEMLLKFYNCTEYNSWQLNEALYRYAESSISALFWLYPGQKNVPFVHKFLREWRNINQHTERLDISLSTGIFNVEKKYYELPVEYNIFPVILSNRRLRKVVEDQFSSEKIATDATVSGLVFKHDLYMRRVFACYEAELNEILPPKYLQSSILTHTTFDGGEYTRFIANHDFWSGKK